MIPGEAEWRCVTGGGGWDCDTGEAEWHCDNEGGGVALLQRGRWSGAVSPVKAE